jgi:outer membrane receptor protein involved in Fe transport
MYCAWSLSAEAKEPAISLPAGTLPQAIADIAREAGVSIGSDAPLPPVRTPRIENAHSVGEALSRLLAGSGLVARRVSPTAWRIEQPQGRAAPPPAAPSTTSSLAEPEIGPPIIVTGTKRRLELQNAPLTVSVVDLRNDPGGDTARDSQWSAGQVEGLALTDQGAGRNRMFLRGVADSPFNGDSQATVAVLLDDARLTYAAPDPDIRLVDVERVEVLKGPQGALYGTGALGGIYHIVTRRADLSRSSLSASAGVGGLDRGGPGADGSLIVNVPIIPDEVGARLVAYAARESGWTDTGARKDSDWSDVVGVRTGLSAELGADWRLDATAFGQWLNSADTHYVYRPGARDRPAQIAEPHDNDLRHVALAAHRSGAIDIVASSGFTWHEVRDRYDATQGAAAFGIPNPQALDDTRRYRTWDGEIRATGLTGPFSWLAGLSHVDARQFNDRSVTSSAGNVLRLGGTRRVVSDSALFGEATFTPLPKVDLTIGGRLFSDQVRDKAIGPAASESETHIGFTPSIALSYRPRTGRLLFARYGSAVRQGAPRNAGPSLPSDELATLEVGWRETTPSRTFDLGAYYSDWEDVQSDAYVGPGLLGTITAGRARIVGLEASFKGRVARAWQIEAGAALQSALLVRNATGVPQPDRRLPIIPEYTLRSAVSHPLAIGGHFGRVSAGLRYVGPARFSFDPQLDLPIDAHLESYLEGQLSFGRFDLGLRAENLTGSAADTLPFGNPLRALVAREYTPLRPTSVRVQMRWTN